MPKKLSDILKPEPNATEESKVRIEAFIKEYGILVEKYKVDFAHYPMYIPLDGGGFKTILQSIPVDITNNVPQN